MSRILSIALIAVQLIDVLVHAATDQLEPLRVTSNVIILLWLALMALDRLRANAQVIGGIALAAYIILNGTFLVLEGFTNPAQGGAPRVALFVLVGLTVILSRAKLSRRMRRPA